MTYVYDGGRRGGGDLVCPWSFYQTAFQELAWPKLDLRWREGGRRGPHQSLSNHSTQTAQLNSDRETQLPNSKTRGHATVERD